MSRHSSPHLLKGDFPSLSVQPLHISLQLLLNLMRVSLGCIVLYKPSVLLLNTSFLHPNQFGPINMIILLSYISSHRRMKKCYPSLDVTKWINWCVTNVRGYLREIASSPSRDSQRQSLPQVSWLCSSSSQTSSGIKIATIRTKHCG